MGFHSDYKNISVGHYGIMRGIRKIKNEIPLGLREKKRGLQWIPIKPKKELTLKT